MQKRVREVSSSSHTAENSVDSFFTSIVVVGFSDVVGGGVVVVLVRVPLGLADWFSRVLLLDCCIVQMGVYWSFFGKT